MLFRSSEQDLAHRVCDDRFRALMRFEVARARALFTEGFELRDRVRGRVRTPGTTDSDSCENRQRLRHGRIG